MNYWDKLPDDVQKEILMFRAVKTIQRNWRRHPAIRSIYIAKACLNKSVSESCECWGLEYCAKHSGLKDISFWVEFGFKIICELYEVYLFSFPENVSIFVIETNILRSLIAVKTLIEKFERALVVTEEDKSNFQIRIQELQNILHRDWTRMSHNCRNLHDLKNRSDVLDEIVIEKNIKNYYDCVPWCF